MSAFTMQFAILKDHNTKPTKGHSSNKYQHAYETNKVHLWLCTSKAEIYLIEVSNDLI